MSDHTLSMNPMQASEHIMAPAVAPHGALVPLQRPEPRRGPWSQSEDKELLNLVKRGGAQNWVNVAAALQTRTPKQCRERYHQNLKNTLDHSPITDEEGEMINELVNSLGKKWAEISRRMPGRSDNAVKNWWNGHQTRKKKVAEPRRREDHLVAYSSHRRRSRGYLFDFRHEQHQYHGQHHAEYPHQHHGQYHSQYHGQHHLQYHGQPRPEHHDQHHGQHFAEHLGQHHPQYHGQPRAEYHDQRHRHYHGHDHAMHDLQLHAQNYAQSSQLGCPGGYSSAPSANASPMSHDAIPSPQSEAGPDGHGFFPASPVYGTSAAELHRLPSINTFDQQPRRLPPIDSMVTLPPRGYNHGRNDSLQSTESSPFTVPSPSTGSPTTASTSVRGSEPPRTKESEQVSRSGGEARQKDGRMDISSFLRPGP